MLRDTHQVTHPTSLSILPSPSKSLWSLVTCILRYNTSMCVFTVHIQFCEAVSASQYLQRKNGLRSGQHFPEAKKR